MRWKERAGYLLPDELFRAIRYRQEHGRWPNHRQPRRLTEKLNWRVLRDRRPILAWTCDKLAMKERAAECEYVRIPRTYWSGPDLAGLVGVDLPDRWVLKPNNGSGRVHLGSGPVDPAGFADLKGRTRGWLVSRELRRMREWAYRHARPVFLVEEFIGDGPSPPPDVKFFVFHGRPEFIATDVNRFGDHRRAYYSLDWDRLPVRTGIEPASDQPRPRHLERMAAIATELGRDFDHIRIDLYEVGDEIWFGEYTPYSWSGMRRVIPDSFDIAWGDLWQLPDEGSDR